MKSFVCAFLVGSTLCIPSLIIALESEDWQQIGTEICGEAAYDWSSGKALNASGSRMAIGAPGNDGNGQDAGRVRIFELNGDEWVQLGEDIDGQSPGGRSGIAASLNAEGNRVAIGAYFAGQASVFECIGGSWTQIGSYIDGGSWNGYKVSLSADGTRLAVGAPAITSQTEPGYVRIFDYSGGDWIQIGSDIIGEAARDFCGDGLFLSGDGTRVAVGASGNDGNGEDSGHVRIFELINGDWAQLGSDIHGEAAEDISGSAVSLNSNGTRVAIGAYWNDGNGQDAGHVRIFEYNGSSWVQLGADIDGDSAGDNFGGSASLSADGSRLATGSWGDDMYTRVFEFADGEWQQLGSDIEREGDDDWEGCVISADGSRVAASQVNNFDASGCVGVFELSSGGSSQLDLVAPTISSFLVTPTSISSGSKVTASYTVSDSGGSGLDRVELWRTADLEGEPDPNWSVVSTDTGMNGDGPVAGSLEDAPPEVGEWWYGIDVFDVAGNQSYDFEFGLGPIKITVESINDPQTWYARASHLTNGWRWFDWLGAFNVSNDPWIYHAQHGWLYPFADSPESVYFWDGAMGSILWTSDSVYPAMYRFSDAQWLFYQKDTGAPRWFVNLLTGQWEQW